MSLSAWSADLVPVFDPLRAGGAVIDFGGAVARIRPQPIDEIYKDYLKLKKQDPSTPIPFPDGEVNVDLLKAMLGTAPAEGGVVGGGGTGVKISDEPMFLVDLGMYLKDIKDTPALPGPSIYSQPLTEKNAIEGLPLDLERQAPISMKIVRQALDNWRARSPQVVALVETGLKKATWRATMFKLAATDTAFLPSWVPRDKTRIQTIGAVIRGYGVWLRAPTWDRELGEFSRAGLLVHEALRFMRLETGLNLSDRSLQMITAGLILFKPQKPDDNLDRELLGETWRLAVPAAFQDADWFPLIVKKICLSADSLIQDAETRVAPDAPALPPVSQLCEIEKAAQKSFDQVLSPMGSVCGARNWSEVSGPNRLFWSWNAMIERRLQRLGTPAVVSHNHPMGFTRPLQALASAAGYRDALEQLKRLRPLACGDHPSPRAQVDFGAMSYLVLKYAADQVDAIAPREFIFQFQVPRGLPKEDLAILDKAYFKAVQAATCELNGTEVKLCRATQAP